MDRFCVDEMSQSSIVLFHITFMLWPMKDFFSNGYVGKYSGSWERSGTSFEDQSCAECLERMPGLEGMQP
jgi:hypothetical protein